MKALTGLKQRLQAVYVNLDELQNTFIKSIITQIYDVWFGTC